MNERVVFDMELMQSNNKIKQIKLLYFQDYQAKSCW